MKQEDSGWRLPTGTKLYMAEEDCDECLGCGYITNHFPPAAWSQTCKCATEHIIGEDGRPFPADLLDDD